MDMTTNYYALYPTKAPVFLKTEKPANGEERYKIACEILRDNPEIPQVLHETPADKTGTWIQNRHENYTLFPKE
jgi:hypothetical protein